MKKVIYISILILTLGFVSCTKQDIQPINQVEQDVPTWEKGLTPTTITGDSDVVDDGSDDDGIVDPNYDPDGKSKRN